MNADTRATLKRVQMFAGLTEAELDYLSARAVPKRYGAGEIIFSEGEP